MNLWKRIAVLWSVIRTDARVLWHALQHPQSPRWLKFGTLGMVLYLISPVDLIPDVVPLLGIADDLVIIPMVMRWLLGRLPAHVREQAERRARGERDPSDTDRRGTRVRIVD
ncbi:MAG: hypothetical protein RL456_371 [Pseudomonadota bacterium]|jgi:uncharacterized membrane protein YkvA (DUF1232 family)